MKMRNKILLAIIPVMLIGIVLINVIFWAFFKNFVEKQEDVQINTSVASVSDFINEKNTKYLGTVNDWGHWDDTFEYIKTNDAEYIERNLDESTFENLDLNFVILTNSSQEVVYNQYYSQQDSAFSQSPQSFDSELDAIVSFSTQYEDISCILKIANEYYFFASSDVTDSIITEDPIGKIIIGRMLDADTIESIEEISGCKITGISTSEYTENTSETDAAAYFEKSVNASGDAIDIELFLPNSYRSADSVQFNLELSRGLYRSSMKQLLTFTMFSVLASSLIIVLIIHIWSNLLTKPFEKLVREVEAIDVTKGAFTQISETGTIEFLHLRQSINFLLNRIERVQRDLDDSRKELQATLISVGDGVIVTDTKFNISFMNPVAQRLTGWSDADAKNTEVSKVFNIINEHTRKKVASPIEQVFERREIVELANHTLLIAKDGTEIPIEDTAAPIIDDSGVITGCVLVFRDSSKQKEKQRQIEYLSYHDQLTGLYNRRFFEEEFRRLDVGRNLPLAVVYADVNGLKIMNDAFGHDKGDKLITLVAEAMQETCRSDDIIARIGGDEFVLLLPQTDLQHAENIIERIKIKIASLQIEGISVSVSFGMDIKTEPGQRSNDVLKNAEKDMYQLKSSGINNRNQIIKAIVCALFQKCPMEETHSRRVGEICREIGKASGSTFDEVKQLGIAGEMHDIGKIFVDDTILNKASKLDPVEWIQMKRHPEIGCRLLGASVEYHSIADIVLSHHERWDGRGYPKGLKGEEIRWESRVVAIAEAYETMLSMQQPYRAALTKHEAIQELKTNAGIQFDPQLVDLLVDRVIDRLPFGSEE